MNRTRMAADRQARLDRGEKVDWDPSAPMDDGNPLGSTDPELTELLNEYATTVDVDAQTPILEKINTFVVDNAWDAPLYFGGQDFAMSKGYTYLGATASLFSTLRQFGVAE